MKVVFHLGVHCTDDGNLLKCLFANHELLEKQGIIVPDPKSYCEVITQALMNLKGQVAPESLQKTLYDSTIGQRDGERVVLSWENFLAFWQWSFRRRLYPDSAERIRSLASLFPNAECEFHIALRNIATFLPGLHQRYAPQKPWAEFMRGVDPLGWRWSTVIYDIIMQVPGVSLTIWRDEDAPLIWPEILQAVSDCKPNTLLSYIDAYWGELITPEGMTQMLEKLRSGSYANMIERRKVISYFLENYPRSDKTELEISVPDWNEDTISMLNGIYQDDIDEIKQMPGVRFIAP